MEPNAAQRTGETQIIEPPTGSIMAIAAHPNDIESWCGGTLARAVDGGATVRLLLVTSGDKGSSDPSDTPQAVAERREAEARAAAHVLGLSDVAFLRYLDGEAENSRELRREMVAWIRAWRPDVLFTHDPERPEPPYIFHRDHRAVGRAALDAVYPLARDPLSLPEQRAQGLHPHAVREAWLFASATADCYVDIRKTLEQKIAARLEHASQTPDPDALPAIWRQRARRFGEPTGLPAAETFAVVTLD